MATARHQLAQSQHYQTSSMYSQPACRGCSWVNHCKGQRDAITGVTNTAADKCEAFEAYEQSDYGHWPLDKSTTPQRVEGARRLHLVEVQ